MKSSSINVRAGLVKLTLSVFEGGVDTTAKRRDVSNA